MRNSNISPQARALHEQLVQHLRRSPATRGVLYLATNALLLEVGSRLRDKEAPFSGEWMHIALSPLVATVTTAFAQMEQHEQANGESLPFKECVGEFVVGAGLGAGALLVSLSIARAKGWVRAPHWGWQNHAMSDLMTTTAFIAASHLAVAYNEETVFRGYGYSTMRRALPPAAAGGIMTLLFGLAHKLDPQVFLGEVALGLPLLLLRVQTDNIAASLGYHWAWNVVQTAVFAATNERPALRPLELYGPYLWTGRPGFPEPGLLSTLVNTAVAAGLVTNLVRRNGGQPL